MKSLPPRLEFYEGGALGAFQTSCRSTCPRAHVGCKLYAADKVVVSDGYNGVPPGQPQCDEVGCVMVDGHCSLTIHAELNAKRFAQRHGVQSVPGGYAFVTIRPCWICFNELRDFGIRHMLYLNDYNNQDDRREMKRICRRENIELEKLPFTVAELLTKAIRFHQGPGGILTMKPWLSISDEAPA